MHSKEKQKLKLSKVISNVLSQGYRGCFREGFAVLPQKKTMCRLY